jgi:hypothetical protein
MLRVLTDSPISRAEQYALPYTASTDLSVLMLNNFVTFLEQTDVTQVTWAQYMDVTCCNGTGLLDYYGNARPSWHSFRFWGDVPTERVVTPRTPPPCPFYDHPCRDERGPSSVVENYRFLWRLGTAKVIELAQDSVW